MLNMYFSPTCAPETEKKNHCVCPGAVVPVEEQVVLVAVHVHRAPQVAALEARLEEQPATRHPVGAGGHEYHAVIHDAVEHLPVLGELTPAFGGRLDERPLSALHPRQRLYRLRWRQRSWQPAPQRTKETPTGPFGAGSFACAALASGAEDFIAPDQISKPPQATHERHQHRHVEAL